MNRESKLAVTPCEEIQEILSSKLDGEAQPDELIAAAQHLDKCLECAAYELDLIESEAQLSTANDELVKDFDSDQLWEDIKGEIDRFDNNRDSYKRKRWLATVAVAACLIISVTVTAMLMHSSQKILLPVVAETVRDYETFQVRGELLDVHLTSTTEIVQWMAAKLDFTLPEMVSPPVGYKISGGRLCSFLNRRLAFFQYQRDSDDLALYIMEAEGLEVPARGQYQTTTTEQGLTTVTWSQEQLVYVLVSELPAPVVVDFASRSQSS